MAKLKGIEEFVAKSLQIHFSKSSKEVSFDEGEDPPDIYLKINGDIISVEITELDQNVLNGRKTIDYGYLKFINNLNKEFTSQLNGNINLFIVFYHNNTKVSKISKDFKKYLKSLLRNHGLNNITKIENCIGKVCFKIESLKRLKHKSHCISGTCMPFGGIIRKSRGMNTIVNQIADSNLSLQTYGIIINRIQDKIEKCKNIKETKWLALFDNYYNKFTYFDNNEHIEHYQEVFENIKDFGIFDKILVVFENKDVLEFTHNKLLERNI